MAKHKRDEKLSGASEQEPKKSPRREFLGRTGLTAGGVLTALAAGGGSKGEPLPGQRLMNPEVFRKMLNEALTDRRFQEDIQNRGFKALDARGYQHGVPADVQVTLNRALFTTVGTRMKPRCGVCGVCGICGLCGEVNAGSASAALWALFALA